MPDQRKFIFVLGPHRSGTSLCASGLEALGAELRIASNFSNAENPKGFFEQREVVEFNERLLEGLGGSWDSPLFDGGAVLEVKRFDDLASGGA